MLSSGLCVSDLTPPTTIRGAHFGGGSMESFSYYFWLIVPAGALAIFLSVAIDFFKSISSDDGKEE